MNGLKKKSDLSDSEQPESMRRNLFDKQNFNYDDYQSDIETEWTRKLHLYRAMIVFRVKSVMKWYKHEWLTCISGAVLSMGGALNVQGHNYNENIGPKYNRLGLNGQVDDFVQVTSEKNCVDEIINIYLCNCSL